MSLAADAPLIEPDLNAALERIAGAQKLLPPVDPGDVKQTRVWFEEWATLASQLAPRYELTTLDHMISDAPVSVASRIYRPPAPRSRMLFIHGGGWAIGSLNTHDSVARWLASQSRSEIIALNYDLAPEQPFPRAVDQTLSALRAAIALSVEDALPLLVMGDSAGADIASLALLRTEKEELESIKAFVSLYGAFEPDLDLPSHLRFADGPFLRRSDMDAYWGFFAGELRGPERRRLTPLDANLNLFPTTFCVAAECDLLRDDSVALHNKILGDGGLSTLECWRGMPHGCMHFVGIVPSVTRAADSILKFIATATTSGA